MKLTEREKTIITLLEKGLKNKDVAVSLGIDERNVAGCIVTIRKKLKIDSKNNLYHFVKTAKKKAND